MSNLIVPALLIREWNSCNVHGTDIFLPYAAICGFHTMNRSLIRSLLDAYVPQLALLGSLALVPYLLLWLTSLEGFASEGELWTSATDKCFFLLVFNVFIGYTISGTLFGSLQQIIDSPRQVIELLGSSVPPNATFFITYVALM